MCNSRQVTVLPNAVDVCNTALHHDPASTECEASVGRRESALFPTHSSRVSEVLLASLPAAAWVTLRCNKIYPAMTFRAHSHSLWNCH